MFTRPQGKMLFLSVDGTLRVKDLLLVVLDDDCAFSSFLQKYHHVVFGTTARLLVSINGEKE